MAVALVRIEQGGRHIYQGLSADTRPVSPPIGSEYFISEGGVEKYLGVSVGWKQTHSATGAAHVYPKGGTGNPLRGRWIQLDNASGIKGVEFPSGANIKHLTFDAVPVAGTAALAGDERVLICIDADDAIIAAAMLAQVESTVSDVQWIPITINKKEEIPLLNALTKGALGGGTVYAKTVGGIAIDLWIGGC